MAGQQPFINRSGLNLLPFLGNSLGNSQQFITQLTGLRMPQPNNYQESYGQDSYGRQRMQLTDDHYNREPLDQNDRGERPFRELYGRSTSSRSQERDNYANENQDRIRGLMDRDIPLDFLFPEMGSRRHDERFGREEFEAQNYGTYRSRSQSPDRSKAETRDREPSPSESKYGARNDTTVPWNALLRLHCYLVPPLDDTYVLALSEKQPGCCTVFIGGLPSMADEDIIREIFGVCGPIEKISVNNVRANTQVKHCQLRFFKQDSVERAVKFNGHVLVIGDGGNRKTKIGRIRVDYDKLPNDNREMKSNTSIKQQQPQNKEEKHLSTVYTYKQAFHLLDMIRHDQAITESLNTLVHWLEKGECNRSTVNVFHTLLNTVHSLIKRLINRRKEDELRMEKQKQQAVERANEIKQQCETVWKVFEAATRQKSWDHFTKAQRKNLSQWHAAIKTEIKSAKEAEIQNRVEVGMDLDDEVPSLGGLIEQPALQMEDEEQKQGPDQTSLAPSKAKKRRVEASESNADSTDSLKLENKKLRTQVESLKAIAEQNTSLMWSMQSNQYQAEEVRQQYSNMMAAKDYEIFRLKNALQGAILRDPQRAMSELEIVVDLSKGDQNITDMDLETEEVTESYEVSKENNKEVTQEVDKQGNGAEDHEGDKNLEDSSGMKQSDTVCSVLCDDSNKEELCLPSQPGQVMMEEGDVDHDGVPVEKGSIDIETGEKGIGDGMENVEQVGEERQADSKETDQVEEEEKIDDEGQADSKETGQVEEEEKLGEEGQADSKETDQAEEEEKTDGKEEMSIEDEKHKTKDEEKQSEQEEKQSEEEEEKEVEEDNAAEEGSGRFVEIDDEQFEVIDDMDEEDSDDDCKQVAVSTPMHENDEVNRQFASDSSGNQPEYSAEKKQDSEVATHVNSDLVNRLQPYSDSASCAEPDYSTKEKTEGNEDDYKEVRTVHEQLPTNSSNYQPDYNSQYQAWLSTAVTSNASMDYGPAQVRISGEELVIVGIMCSYLQLCPSGATSGEIRDYLSRQFKERRKDVVERLLYSLPVLFKAEDASGNAKWKFCGFEKLTEMTSKQ